MLHLNLLGTQEMEQNVKFLGFHSYKKNMHVQFIYNSYQRRNDVQVVQFFNIHSQVREASKVGHRGRHYTYNIVAGEIEFHELCKILQSLLGLAQICYSAAD